MTPRLTPEQLGAVDDLAAAWRLSERLEPFAGCRWTGEEAPTLHLDDVSGIPFLDGVPGMEEYQHRARVRCGDGDLFAAVTSPAEGYERYCRDQLGMGSPEFVLAEPVGSVIEVAEACRRGQAFTELKQAAQRRGALHVHPYMGIEAVWALALDLEQHAKVPVQVIAPPPPVTWIANDKGQLTQLIDVVIGSSARAAGEQGRDFSQLAAALGALSGRCERVALKRSRCASAMGNRVFASHELRDLSHDGLLAVVERFAQDTQWDGQEDLLVCEWLDAAASPSTQLWIPPKGSGAPRVDGIYEQLLEGEQGVFLGSRPSTLPSPVNAALAERSLTIAAALQRLGYAGRCSFDLLVTGDLEGAFEVVFSECNGRWGGTSTPMALVDRLVRHPNPPGPRAHYRAQDVLFDALIGRPLDDVIEALGDELYRPGQGGRFILYNVGPLARSGKLDVVALAPTNEAADEAMLARLPSLLGLG